MKIGPRPSLDGAFPPSLEHKFKLPDGSEVKTDRSSQIASFHTSLDYNLSPDRNPGVDWITDTMPAFTIQKDVFDALFEDSVHEIGIGDFLSLDHSKVKVESNADALGNKDVYPTAAPVPEPATMLLLGSGLLGLAGYRKKLFRK